MSDLFEGLKRQLLSRTHMLQHGALLMNPTRTPHLFIDPQSVKGAIDLYRVNIQA